MNVLERITAYSLIVGLMIFCVYECRNSNDQEAAMESLNSQVFLYRNKVGQSVAEVQAVTMQAAIFKKQVLRQNSTIEALQKLVNNKTQSAVVIKTQTDIKVTKVPEIVLINNDTCNPVYVMSDSTRFHDIHIIASKDSVSAAIKLFSELHVASELKRDAFWKRPYINTVVTELNSEIEVVDMRSYHVVPKRQYTGLKCASGFVVGFGLAAFLLLR